MTEREETELLKRIAWNVFGVILHPRTLELARKRFREWSDATVKAGGWVA